MASGFTDTQVHRLGTAVDDSSSYTITSAKRLGTTKKGRGKYDGSQFTGGSIQEEEDPKLGDERFDDFSNSPVGRHVKKQQVLDLDDEDSQTEETIFLGYQQSVVETPDKFSNNRLSIPDKSKGLMNQA